MPPREDNGFRRVLFLARPREELVRALPGERLEWRGMASSDLRLSGDQVGVLLFEESAAKPLSGPPPDDLGEGADRIGVLFVGDGAEGVDPFWSARGYFSLPADAPSEQLGRAIRSLFRVLEERALSARARRSLQLRSEEIRALIGVGIALSAERDHDRLLATVLSSARGLTQADAGSLYLTEESESGPVLKFVLAQNDSVRFDFAECTLPLDDSSIAAFVARTGEAVNLPDVGSLTSGAPYRFDSGFDEKHGYQTRSMLTVPMRTPNGRTIGVLQLLNRKKLAFPGDAATTGVMRVENVPFDAQNEEIARALAAQAAVAVENRRLTESIHRLFEGFVEASVTAIEQRDPTTSGHSERVALLSCALAELAGKAESGPFAAYRPGREELRELRYAAVLHDFGKVGVREQILVKARKLPPGRREIIRSRIDQAILSAAGEAWENAARGKWSERRLAVAVADRIAALEKAWKTVLQADEPSLLADEVGAEVRCLAQLTYRDASGTVRPLFDPEEIGFLSIPKGSLDARERLEIESHVTQTFRFLSKIPWTPDLARVPDWAYAHHEKLDGSGYPRGLTAGSLPLPVRAITICDIYDALAARDRPYKKSVPTRHALDILREEAARGTIDAALLELFIEGKVYENVGGRKT